LRATSPIPLDARPAYRTKKDIAVDHVRDGILSGRYTAGEHLRLQDLARDLGLSITPVREALQHLQAEGLLTHFPHHGARVADLRPVEVAELYLIRLALEPLAAGLAAQHITDDDLAELRSLQAEMERLRKAGRTDDIVPVNLEIHRRIYEATGLSLLSSIIAQLWSRAPRDILSVLPGRAMESVAEHQEILEALENHDAPRATTLMRRHLEDSKASLIKYLQRDQRAQRIPKKKKKKGKR
jgi:DNA-binding GntR family transcriptional regulator